MRLRNPRTTQELRWSFAIYDESPVLIKIRASRKKKLLPDAWDDIPVSGKPLRNWKKYRFKQWKVKYGH